MQRNFHIVSMAWGGLLFPNPETSFHSRLAKLNNNNNITGFANARVDELLAAYDKEFDQQKRVAIIQEIDGILANEHHYILEWDMPFQRIAYWNKFGHPESYLTRIGDYRDITETQFDAVSSIGLTEHIGVANYPAYFAFLMSKMRTGALLLNHCITRYDNRHAASATALIDRYARHDQANHDVPVMRDFNALVEYVLENNRAAGVADRLEETRA